MASMVDIYGNHLEASYDYGHGSVRSAHSLSNGHA